MSDSVLISTGGAQSDTKTPLTENKVRGVAKDNPLGREYHEASAAHLGRNFIPTPDVS